MAAITVRLYGVLKTLDGTGEVQLLLDVLADGTVLAERRVTIRAGAEETLEALRTDSLGTLLDKRLPPEWNFRKLGVFAEANKKSERATKLIQERINDGVALENRC